MIEFYHLVRRCHLAIEKHVLEEVGRQLDYYVDAYRKVRDADLKLSALSVEMDSVQDERAEAERLRDGAQAQIDSLLDGVPEDDREEVMKVVDVHLAPLVRYIVS